MRFILNSVWAFGINELINCIAAGLTFAAICVSLYLAQKSKTVKYKILGDKINLKAFKKHQYQQINVINNGHIKFTCTSAGYYINGKYYFVDYISGLRKLNNNILEKLTHITSVKSTEQVILPAYVQEGDMLQLGLFPADYDFSGFNKNYKVYVFIMINGEIRKHYTDYRVFDFQEHIENFSKKSMFNTSATLHNSKARDILDDYFR